MICLVFMISPFKNVILLMLSLAADLTEKESSWSLKCFPYILLMLCE